MEETLQHEETTQCIGISTTGLGNHRSHGPIAGHALTFKMDHSSGAGQNLMGDQRGRRMHQSCYLKVLVTAQMI
jgi:hypothetical protein